MYRKRVLLSTLGTLTSDRFNALTSELMMDPSVSPQACILLCVNIIFDFEFGLKCLMSVMLLPWESDESDGVQTSNLVWTMM